MWVRRCAGHFSIRRLPVDSVYAVHMYVRNTHDHAVHQAETRDPFIYTAQRNARNYQWICISRPALVFGSYHTPSIPDYLWLSSRSSHGKSRIQDTRRFRTEPPVAASFLERVAFGFQSRGRKKLGIFEQSCVSTVIIRLIQLR